MVCGIRAKNDVEVIVPGSSTGVKVEVRAAKVGPDRPGADPGGGHATAMPGEPRGSIAGVVDGLGRPQPLGDSAGPGPHLKVRRLKMKLKLKLNNHRLGTI